MLGSVLRGGHLEHVSNTKQSLPGVSICDDLKDREIFQHAVHHISLRQVLQLPRNEEILL